MFEVNEKRNETDVEHYDDPRLELYDYIIFFCFFPRGYAKTRGFYLRNEHFFIWATNAAVNIGDRTGKPLFPHLEQLTI